MDIHFTSSDRFLLRAPVLPRLRLRPDPSSTNGVRERVEYPMVREAVAVASAVLIEAVDKVLAGQEPATERLRGALARYELRMAGRPTPFGLLAGVAVGGFADRTEAKLGSSHRRHVRPDHAWLERWANGLEADAEVLVRLEVTANNLCSRHGDRLTVPRGTRLASVRGTAAVTRVLDAARHRIAVHDLVDVVAEEFPRVTRPEVVTLVAQLVRLRFLQTTLRQSEKPLEYVTGLLPADSPHGARAAVIADATDAYRRSPIGEGAPELAEVRRATADDNPVQVDLELDARVRLPHEVAREVERAASVVWRLSAPDNARSRNLADFHGRFLERYGLGELVPVLDLLDPDVGIGPPAGYERPWAATSQDDVRQPVLNRLLARAMADGVTEVDLDDDLIAQLSPPGGTPPTTVELFATLNAVSVDALERGDFELVVSPLTGTQQAGASLARFGYLPEVRDLLAELASVRSDDRVPVQLVHLTTHPRDANVVRAPRVLGHSLAIGVPGDGLDPADIAVVADEHRLRLYSVSLGREIAPRVLHVLDISAAAPEVVRFLWDVSLMGVRTLKPWDWAALRDSPFLPAVRCGRTVLAPARWQVTEVDVGTDEALAAWRERWRVPDRVRLTHLDQQLCLDLGTREHRALLREDLRKSGTAVLFEDRAPALDQGWLHGPDGAHEVELVVPLIAVDPETRSVRPPASVRRTPAPHLPGGEWVSAHIQCSPHRQREVLFTRLNPWLATLDVDRWFFLRYQTADQPPHIRLRLRGDVLPRVRDQVAALVDARLASGFSVHPYRPEVERYGGERLIDLAERFFAADSRLALRGMGTAQDTVAVAADVVALISSFHGARWPSWLLSEIPKKESTHRAFGKRRGDALAAITLNPVPADREWAELLAQYGNEARALAEAGNWASPGEILRALLHMHCNRRLGADFRAEAEVYAMARGAVKAHVDRVRLAR
ncbi:lantibiotic dehydratase [Umezawaea endophytica]|uniref:Lantibiotic dehydratase n=1 Tax=Umezawaea endophytica TaxID=1654476 RepID=A0A9X3A315_9PSEU|nr:lantibiotic dehydratase [Umezawaea endophytica]MCS7479668.1 lantibiotic dehydratase [Umezawaea endophytica]